MRRTALLALALLAGCGTGTVATGVLAHLLLPSGPQHATIHIELTSSRAPSFSGNIAGQPLTGRYSGMSKAGQGLCGRSSLPESSQAFTYTGSYDGQAYSFDGCTNVVFLHGNSVVTIPTGPPTGGTGNPLSSITGTRLVFRVKGHIGSKVIAGSANWTVKGRGSSCSPSASCSVTMPFSGSIGSQKLSGTATLTEQSSKVGVIVAKLTVS